MCLCHQHEEVADGKFTPGGMSSFSSRDQHERSLGRGFVKTGVAVWCYEIHSCAGHSSLFRMQATLYAVADLLKALGGPRQGATEPNTLAKCALRGPNLVPQRPPTTARQPQQAGRTQQILLPSPPSSHSTSAVSPDDKGAPPPLRPGTVRGGPRPEGGHAGGALPADLVDVHRLFDGVTLQALVARMMRGEDVAADAPPEFAAVKASVLAVLKDPLATFLPPPPN